MIVKLRRMSRLPCSAPKNMETFWFWAVRVELFIPVCINTIYQLQRTCSKRIFLGVFEFTEKILSVVIYIVNDFRRSSFTHIHTLRSPVSITRSTSAQTRCILFAHTSMLMHRQIRRANMGKRVWLRINTFEQEQTYCSNMFVCNPGHLSKHQSD